MTADTIKVDKTYRGRGEETRHITGEGGNNFLYGWVQYTVLTGPRKGQTRNVSRQSFAKWAEAEVAHE